MTRPWTPDEDRVLYWAVRRGIPRKMLCRPLDRDHRSISCRERRLGISSGRASFFWNGGLMGDDWAVQALAFVPVEPPAMRQAASLHQLLVETAGDYGVERAALLGIVRPRRLKAIRDDFIWRARRLVGVGGRHRYPATTISEFLGGYAYTNVLKAALRHEARLAAERAHPQARNSHVDNGDNFVTPLNQRGKIAA